MPGGVETVLCACVELRVGGRDRPRESRGTDGPCPQHIFASQDHFTTPFVSQGISLAPMTRTFPADLDVLAELFPRAHDARIQVRALRRCCVDDAFWRGRPTSTPGTRVQKNWTSGSIGAAHSSRFSRAHDRTRVKWLNAHCERRSRVLPMDFVALGLGGDYLLPRYRGPSWPLRLPLL